MARMGMACAVLLVALLQAGCDDCPKLEEPSCNCFHNGSTGTVCDMPGPYERVEDDKGCPYYLGGNNSGPDCCNCTPDGGDGGEDGGEDGDAGVPDGDTDQTDGDAGSGDDGGGPPTCSILPADNPWNTDISGYPVHANSDAFIASIGAGGSLHADFGTVWAGAPNGIPYVEVDANTPLQAVEFMYSDESDPGPYPIPADAPIEGGPDGDGDRHILMLDRQACTLYELYYAWPPGQGENPHQDRWYAGSGAIFDLTTNDLRPDYWTSADAAGLPIFPGLVRYEEAVEQGQINHALRFTIVDSQRGFIHPATHFASNSDDPDRPPMGLRLRLKAGYDISGFSPEIQVILQALKTYGMFVADNGSDWYISGAPDPRWNDDHLHELGDVPGSAFEVVDTGPIIH